MVYVSSCSSAAIWWMVCGRRAPAQRRIAAMFPRVALRTRKRLPSCSISVSVKFFARIEDLKSVFHGKIWRHHQDVKRSRDP